LTDARRAAGADTVNDRALTLDRGLRVLGFLAASERDVSVAEIANELSLHRQAIYRLLGTLEDHGLAMKSAPGRYRLGFATVNLVGAWLPRLEAAVRPLLMALAEQCSATAVFAGSEGADAVALIVAEPTHTGFHIAYRPGARHPLTRGAVGVAILAGRSPEAGESPDVTAARPLGVAITRGQVTPGAIGVAAPVHLWSHSTAADASVGVIAMADGADQERLSHHVLTTARQVDHLIRTPWHQGGQS
jgi:DNA-binding IclR family transcriptional regulator